MKKSLSMISLCFALILLLVSCDTNKAIESKTSTVEIITSHSSADESVELTHNESGTAANVASFELSEKTTAVSSYDSIPASPSKSSANSKVISSATSKDTLPGSTALKKGMTNEEYAQAYDIANEIVNRHKNKEEIEMLCRITEDIYNIYKSGVHSEKDPHYSDVYGVFVLKRASCAGVTRAVCLAMTILGTPYEHVNENQWTHQWCRIFSKSENEYCVLDGQGGYVGLELTPYKHPLIK